jgi:hypothetical protein
MNIDEYLYFLDRAFTGMLAVLDELGDDLANRTPPVDGANAPWAIVFHCGEVADYWIGHVLAGRASARDRAAEFTSTGTVGWLRARIVALQAQLAEDLGAGFDAAGPLRNTPPAEYEGPSRRLSPIGVLLHVLEELAQHHGQVELSRDVLVRSLVPAS